MKIIDIHVLFEKTTLPPRPPYFRCLAATYLAASLTACLSRPPNGKFLIAYRALNPVMDVHEMITEAIFVKNRYLKHSKDDPLCHAGRLGVVGSWMFCLVETTLPRRGRIELSL